LGESGQAENKMFAPSPARIPDPLTDKFALSELPRIAPWVAEELQALGMPEVCARLQSVGLDPHSPQLMSTWVSVVTNDRSPLWEALQVA